MFMQDPNQNYAENVSFFMSPPEGNGNCARYKSAFAAKVRCDCWAEKKGCCRTIGPPPKYSAKCPSEFLKKHSRQLPVFFNPEELKVKGIKNVKAAEDTENIEYQQKLSRLPQVDTGVGRNSKRKVTICEYPRPPSRMGLFRHRKEETYEQKYKLNRPKPCDCDQLFWEDLIEATECAGVMAAELERRGKKWGHSGKRNNNSTGQVKDYIRANAVKVMRMPPRRYRRCYVNECGLHVLDLSDSPFVLRPGFGKVPEYIYKRKMELLQEDIAARDRMAQTQQGTGQECRFVPDMEKEAVIQGLKDVWGQLLHEYNALPLNSAGNERHRELKASLELKMKEVEADLRLLTSTNMLFVGDVNESQYLS